MVPPECRQRAREETILSPIAIERLFVNEPAVVSETIDGEVVVINLDKGTYYSLRNSAAFVWGLVVEGTAVDELLGSVTRRYEGDDCQMRETTRAFLAQLVEEELLRPAQGQNGGYTVARPGDTIELAARVPFVAPALEKYTDMEHLLLLDPIHDVDETGWPNAR